MAVKPLCFNRRIDNNYTKFINIVDICKLFSKNLINELVTVRLYKCKIKNKL